MAGPLAGLKVVELGGIGPVPHAGMVLADLGADVTRIERPGAEFDLDDPLLRGRDLVRVDLADAADRDRVLALIDEADVLIEGFRPGVAERLGVGPEACLRRNPGLVYTRLTGWGQTGPRASTAGHDLNYIAVTGALHAMGGPDAPPSPPLNLVGDYGGGSMFALTGLLAALWERSRTGLGQVVDVAIVDGVASTMQQILSLRRQGLWTDGRHANFLDGGAPFYDCYRCADGGFIAVAAIESAFYLELIRGLGFSPEELPDRDDRANWAELRRAFGERIAERTREDWAVRFAGTDACVTPVLDIEEAAREPQVGGRGALIREPGGIRAGSAPRFGSPR